MRTAYLQTIETYLLEGQTFYSYSEALEYCSTRGLKITSTQALRNGRFLLSASKIDPIQSWVSGVLEISRKKFN